MENVIFDTKLIGKQSAFKSNTEYYDHERKVMNDFRSVMYSKIQRVSIILKGVYVPPDPEGNLDHCQIDFPDNSKIWFRWGSYKLKFRCEVRGEYRSRPSDTVPAIYDANYKPVTAPGITFDGNKSPDQIAKDINNRFYAENLAYTLKVMEQRAKDNDWKSKQESARKQIAELLGDTTGRGETVRGFGDHDIRAQINSGDSITLEIRSLSLSDARKVLNALKRK
jgi:hypothetical protein